MSTAQLRTTGGDHLVETGFVTRGLVSVRMDTRRNIRLHRVPYGNELFQSRSWLRINETGGRRLTFRPRIRGRFAGSTLAT